MQFQLIENISQIQPFSQRLQQLTCARQGHENNSIAALCVHPNCIAVQKAVCGQCIKLHKDHADCLISAEEIAQFLNDYGTRQQQLIEHLKFFRTQINKMLDSIEKRIMDAAGDDYEIIKIVAQSPATSHEQLELLSKSYQNLVISQNVWDRGNVGVAKIQQDIQDIIKQIEHQALRLFKLQETTPQFILMSNKFCQQNKSPEVNLTQIGIVSKCARTQVDGYNDFFWCISENPLSSTIMTKIVTIHFNFYIQKKIKIIQEGYKLGIRIGLGSKRMMQKKRQFSKIKNFDSQRFEFETQMGKGTGNIGLYVISSRGWAYQNSNDRVKSNFLFCTGDIIEFQYNPKLMVG